jgi:hypothetical protein
MPAASLNTTSPLNLHEKMKFIAGRPFAKLKTCQVTSRNYIGQQSLSESSAVLGFIFLQFPFRAL